MQLKHPSGGSHPMHGESCGLQSLKTHKNSDDLTLTEYCKALGNPIRMHILRILIEKNECISGDLAEEVGLSWSTVSEHLRILKTANLVLGSIDGKKRCYCVNKSSLKLFKELVETL